MRFFEVTGFSKRRCLSETTCSSRVGSFSETAGFSEATRFSQAACLSEDRGQASVEAAVLLPMLLLVVGLLLQPVCLFYTRTVMAGAAAEGARVLATRAAGVTTEQVEAFVRRRLAAVPNLGVFCEDDWQVTLEGERSSDVCRVSIEGRARPWPLLGVLVAPFAPDGAVVLRETAEVQTRPDWLEGSYADWKGAW